MGARSLQSILVGVVTEMLFNIGHSGSRRMVTAYSLTSLFVRSMLVMPIT